MNVIETRQLTKAYGHMRAVDALDMHVGAGDIYGFVGKNGAGKSTALKMFAGLTLPTSGEISLFGAVCTPSLSSPFSAGFSRVGALIESPGILPTMSAEENLMAKALALGVMHPRERCRELLELVGLHEVGTRAAKKFSLGMKQRLGLGLALVGGPDLLLLDEPFNGLDPEATRQMRRTLVDLNRERGITIVISSHVLDQLDRMATRFGVIRSGRMVRELTEGEVHAACTSAVRVKASNTARALAVLEQRFGQAAFRVDADDAIFITAGSGPRPADARFGGASDGTEALGMPSCEDVARALSDAGELAHELSLIERDLEEYFVELMGGTDDEETDGARRAGGTFALRGLFKR